jgi:chorismate dehydratase
VFDLATLWHDFTGFGFVFAMWMARANAPEQVLGVDFKAARDEGLAHLDQIAAGYEDKSLTPGEIQEYLTRNIEFQMDEDMTKGLELYFDLALKHQLIESAKPIALIRL